MKRLLSLVVALGILAGPVVAQDRAQSLADIRQELTVLWVELRKLKQELNTSGTAPGVSTAGTALDRVNALESEVQRLTAVTERLEFRIDAIVRDGTNQIGDLEFRLCELEDACDIAALGETPTLGGGDVPVTAAPVAQPDTAGPQLAVGEEADFKRAQEALAAGDFRAAAEQFTAFNQTYPGGPLAAAADLGRGEALENLGDTREAAKAYLQAFSTDQTGPTAPDALFRLGSALAQIGQTNEACVTLGEVAKRYPNALTAQQSAAASMQALGCS